MRQETIEVFVSHATDTSWWPRERVFAVLEKSIQEVVLNRGAHGSTVADCREIGENLDLLPAPIYVKDGNVRPVAPPPSLMEQHRFLFANAAMLRLLGRPIEQIVSRSVEDLRSLFKCKRC
jgi:PAS domain-containing protein